MRLIAWNCAGRLAIAADQLFVQHPDIVVLQECRKETVDSLETHGYESLWFGDEGQEGLAVLCKTPWIATPLAKPTHKWVVPIRVSGPENFILIAVWSVPSKKGLSNYVTLLRDAFEEIRHFLSDGPVVIAGDFNSNRKFDKLRTSHNRLLVESLHSLGLASAYHHLRAEASGEEKEPTFHMQWNREKPFHLDYIFVPVTWMQRQPILTVDAFDGWSALSDHRALTLDLPSAGSLSLP